MNSKDLVNLFKSFCIPVGDFGNIIVEYSDCWIEKMDSLCRKSVKHLMGVKWQTSNWAVELTTGLFNFKFRAKKMKFKYVIKNLFTKENIDNGWVRKIEGMTEFKKLEMLENAVFFDMKGI